MSGSTASPETTLWRSALNGTELKPGNSVLGPRRVPHALRSSATPRVDSSLDSHLPDEWSSSFAIWTRVASTSGQAPTKTGIRRGNATDRERRSFRSRSRTSGRAGALPVVGQSLDGSHGWIDSVRFSCMRRLIRAGPTLRVSCPGRISGLAAKKTANFSWHQITSAGGSRPLASTTTASMRVQRGRFHDGPRARARSARSPALSLHERDPSVQKRTLEHRI